MTTEAHPDFSEERLHRVVTALSASDIMIRVEAVADLLSTPDEARSILVAVLGDAGLPARPRVWAMLAICQIPDVSEPTVAPTLVNCLTDADAIVRRSALETLGALSVASAVPQIAASLSDHTPIPEAWFDDDATPSQAARRALEAIGSPEAKAALLFET